MCIMALQRGGCELILNCVLYILISTETAKLVVFIDVLIEISSLKMPVIV